MAQAPSGGCEGLSTGSLVGATGVATSPDGRSVYGTSYGGDTVSSFIRSRGGKLIFQGCVSDDGAGGCATLGVGSLRGAGGVAVSPSGADVYVASGLGESVERFSRDGSGALTPRSCVADAKLAGCSSVPASGILAGAAGIAFGAGGSDVYVASIDAGTITHLRLGADGQLRFLECLSGGGVEGCRELSHNVLAGVDALALSPSGRELYATSYASGALVRFRVGRSGGLAFRGCIAEGGANSCAKLPHGTLSGAAGLSVSPDGRDLYVASQVGTVTRLQPRRRRGFAFAGCVAERASSGCPAARLHVLSQPTGIAVSPDGRDLYVASQGSNAIAHLRPGPRGSLRLAGCTASAGSHRCTAAPARGLRGAYALAFAPGGRNIYAAAARAGAIASFSRRR